jgi:hypothetical protein
MLTIAYFVFRKREIINPHGVWEIKGIFTSPKSIEQLYFYENKNLHQKTEIIQPGTIGSHL